MCDPFTAATAVSAGTSLLSGVIGGNASSSAGSQMASADSAAVTGANNTVQGMFGKTAANIQPFINAGQTAVGQLSSGTAAGGEFDPSHQFSMSDFQQDPGYQFDLDQGSLALQRSAAAQGTLMSGGTLKALTQYGQGMASNEFENAYNRWNQTRQNNFSNLSSVANLGSTANAQYGQFSGQAAGTISQNTMQATEAAGAANAAGTVGSASALNSGLGGAANALNGYGTLSALMNANSASSYGVNKSLPWQQPGYVNPS